MARQSRDAAPIRQTWRVTVIVAVVAVLAVVGVLCVMGMWRSRDRHPLIAVDNRCPTCNHPGNKHHWSDLTGLHQGCQIDGCECDTTFTHAGHGRWGW